MPSATSNEFPPFAWGRPAPLPRFLFLPGSEMGRGLHRGGVGGGGCVGEGPGGGGCTGQGTGVCLTPESLAGSRAQAAAPRLGLPHTYPTRQLCARDGARPSGQRPGAASRAPGFPSQPCCCPWSIPLPLPHFPCCQNPGLGAAALPAPCL